MCRIVLKMFFVEIKGSNWRGKKTNNLKSFMRLTGFQQGFVFEKD